MNHHITIRSRFSVLSLRGPTSCLKHISHSAIQVARFLAFLGVLYMLERIMKAPFTTHVHSVRYRCGGLVAPESKYVLRLAKYYEHD